MAAGIGTVEVRRARGKLVVQGLGKTARGTRYIRQTIPLSVHKTSDKDFKKQLATAVTEMLAQEELPL